MSQAFPLPADPFGKRDRFLPALGVALLVEAALIAAFMHVPAPEAAMRAAHPCIVRIQMLAPPAPAVSAAEQANAAELYAATLRGRCRPIRGCRKRPP
jgi:hypothetical protein